jgi:hypothetical protein
MTTTFADKAPTLSHEMLQEPEFPWLARLYYRFFGSKRLRAYEKLCLDAWHKSLPDRHRVVLNTQLAAVDLVKRRFRGTSLYFYELRKHNDPRRQSLRFANQAPTCHVADILLAADGGEPGKPIVAKVFLHRGRLWALAFVQRPDRLMRAHGKKKQSTLHVTHVGGTNPLE